MCHLKEDLISENLWNHVVLRTFKMHSKAWISRLFLVPSVAKILSGRWLKSEEEEGLLACAQARLRLQLHVQFDAVQLIDIPVVAASLGRSDERLG